MNFKYALLFCILSNISWTQTAKDYRKVALAEKIYLQINSDIYTTDKTIWFKAILANSATHNLEITSGVLYVDLINSKDEIIESKLVKIKKGIGKGHFDLDRSYTEGKYLIRAYTEWNKNFGNDFFTEKYIRIFSELEKKEKINIIESYEQLDDFGKASDSVILNFFPEGGKLIDGLSTVVGFKATDIYGNGISVDGEVVDEDNDKITTFTSNRLGLGAFELNDVKKLKTYVAKLKIKQNTSFYKLPRVTAYGHTLAIKKRKDVIIATVNSNSNKDQKVKIQAYVRGKNYYKQKENLINGRYIFTIPKTLFPEGIVIFKLEAENGTPIAERLYFNQRDDNRLQIETKINNTNFIPRDEISLNLNITSTEEKQVIVNTSMLVFDKNLYGNFEIKRQNILSYFLLNSDLRGEIEEPSSYFLKDSDLNIDHVMLTHGWRNYKFNQNVNRMPYAMEKGLQIKGIVNVKNKKIL